MFSHLSVPEELDQTSAFLQSGHPANILCFLEMLQPIDERSQASDGWLPSASKAFI